MAEYNVPAGDAGSWMTEEDFSFLQNIQDASTWTTDEDFDFLSQSQSTRDISVSNSESIVDGQSVNSRDQKIFLCNLCDKDLREHLDESANYKLYLCCACTYTNRKRAFLQRHINIHCAKDKCTICDREFTQGEPHLSEKTCNVCKIEFTCKTFLDQHCFVDHKRHFETHFWVCGRHLRDHIIDCHGPSIYECCACGHSTWEKFSQQHNNTHIPQLFCIRCKEEYPAEEKDWHDKEFKCMFCTETFQCHTFLENHLKDHNGDLFSRCICCSETLDMHRKGSPYQCCVCFKYKPGKSNLKEHLYFHSGLRLFKCPECKKRFFYESALRGHSKYCLPIQCEECRARFPTNESLLFHCIEKHTET